MASKTKVEKDKKKTRKVGKALGKRVVMQKPGNGHACGCMGMPQDPQE